MELSAHNIVFSYAQDVILQDISLDFKDTDITVIIGPNGSGKSTLLSLLTGQHTLSGGQVILDKRPIETWGRKELARKLAILPQQPSAPDDILVRDLVAHGRFAYRRLFSPLSADDHLAIDLALEKAEVQQFANRPMQALSGGERQRAWIALALAQSAHWFLLDEPTSFLDLGHQYQVLDVLKQLNRQNGIGVVMVLHDINQACLYADRVIAMKSGNILADGPPDEVVTPSLIFDLYEINVNIISSPQGTPLCVGLVR